MYEIYRQYYIYLQLPSLLQEVSAIKTVKLLKKLIYGTHKKIKEGKNSKSTDLEPRGSYGKEEGIIFSKRGFEGEVNPPSFHGRKKNQYAGLGSM